MRLVSFLAVLLSMSSFACGAGAGETRATSRGVSGVVELFTSQGCSSCPPADSVLMDLSSDPKLVALAYHVDYWDYIGWKDTRGSRDNTERQRAYAMSLGSGSVYTPQAVVNGQRDIAGAEEGAIRKAVGETALDTGDPQKPLITLEIRGDRLHIAAEGKAFAGARPPVLMLITFDKRSEAVVDRGENEGKTLVSANAVRSWRMLGMWDGKPMQVDLPLSMLREEGKPVGCAAILQGVTAEGTPGPILAAVALQP